MKKRRKRTIDKEKVAANKKKAKVRKQRMKQQLKEEKARRKAEKRKGKVVAEAVGSKESITNGQRAAESAAIAKEKHTAKEEKRSKGAGNKGSR